MALNAHITIEGKSQGKISDKCGAVKGREGTCLVVNLEQAVLIPRGPHDGQVHGHRVHEPLVIRKAVDRASPLLQRALATGEEITAEIQFFRLRPTGDGKEENFYTIKLEQGRITSYKLELPSTLDRDNAALPVMERVEFAYGKITSTFVPDGVENVDEWITPST